MANKSPNNKKPMLTEEKDYAFKIGKRDARILYELLNIQVLTRDNCEDVMRMIRLLEIRYPEVKEFKL